MKSNNSERKEFPIKKQNDVVYKPTKIESENELDEILKLSNGDIAYNGIKVGLSSIPIVEGVCSEIFSATKQSPLERRKLEYLRKIDQRLKNLEKNSSIISSNLKNNDEFIDILTYSLQIAIKNSQNEKLEMLRNAVLNSALQIDIELDLQFRFLKNIDDIRLIDLLHSQKHYPFL